VCFLLACPGSGLPQSINEDTHQEIIRNAHPRPGEPSSYVPSGRGWGTGQSFATISFVQNPGRDGQVLILAGANGEDTEAAGELVTSVPRSVRDPLNLKSVEKALGYVPEFSKRAVLIGRNPSLRDVELWEKRKAEQRSVKIATYDELLQEQQVRHAWHRRHYV
jgi:hypothetical protein